MTVSKTWTNSRENYLLEIIVSKENTSTDKLRAFAQEVGATFKHLVSADDGRKIISIGCDEKSLASMVELIKMTPSDFADISMKVSKCEQIPWPGHGEGRLCLLKEATPLIQIVEKVKHHLCLSKVRLAVACNGELASPVQSVALCAGSGSSVLSGVKADVLLTGEMGHHDVLEANHQGSHVILCEHSNTERGFICSLVEEGFLYKLFGGSVDVVMSSKDQEPLMIA
ncbi:hypothetical protein J437_LFUL001161 [Ladona fulva]|uniref:NIF3-like protein 1 n=1 Tax=Ladona fulva TaxID=123851 RepID=A0A8K0JXS6_LADFU|nr:hypothetical protein J437_LFUL001161 [Ladona fulva]